MISNLTNISYNMSSQYNCGTIVSDFSNKVDSYCRVVSIVLIFLIIFEWWAINKVNQSKLSHDKKKQYLAFILIIIHSLILFGAFYLMYWIVLSGLDF